MLQSTLRNNATINAANSSLMDLNLQAGEGNIGAAILEVLMWNITSCEDPANRVITDAAVSKRGDTVTLFVRSECDGWAEDIKVAQWHDANGDCNLVGEDFIGLTEKQADDMMDYQCGLRLTPDELAHLFDNLPCEEELPFM